MRNRLSLVCGAALAVVALAAWTTLAAEETAENDETLTTSTFRVTGMTCGGCEVGVRRVVKKLEGVDEVEASYKKGTATVTYRADEVTPDEIIAAIEELGYTAELASDEEDET